MTHINEQGLDRGGIAAALAAFIFWGLVPIYYKALQTVGAWEVLAHRVIWSVPVLRSRDSSHGQYGRCAQQPEHCFSVFRHDSIFSQSQTILLRF